MFQGEMVVFEIERRIKYWFDSAAYDLDTGRSLLESKRFPYALFFGHLALEKYWKHLLQKLPSSMLHNTHSLTLLASKINPKIPESIIDQLAEYTEFHLESSGIED